MDNIISKNDLVILKEGVSTFEEGQVEFKPNTFYRSIILSNGNHKEVLVYGVVFVNENFDNIFEFAYDKVIRDFKLCGLIKPNGKPISKTAFGKLADIHSYTSYRTKSGLYKAFFYTQVKRGIYAFESSFKETKRSFLNTVYSYFICVINGNMDFIDNNLIQFGNCGIPLTFSDLRVRDTSKDKAFTL